MMNHDEGGAVVLGDERVAFLCFEELGTLKIPIDAIFENGGHVTDFPSKS